MKVGIMIESWELPIFEKRLTDAGYEYEVSELEDGIKFIKVETGKVGQLKALVMAIQYDCATKEGSSNVQ